MNNATDKKVGKYIIKTLNFGTRAWYYKGLLHREDGPAVEYAGGDKEWYLAHEKYTEKEWTIEMRKKKFKALGI